jgi:hypothetical protein
MWKYILIIAILFSLIGCDNRSTSPENEHSAKLEVYFNDELIYNETLTESDDGQTVTLDLPDETQCDLDKYAYEYHFPTEDEEYYYRVLAKKNGFYTKYHACTQQDTIIVDASGGFSPANLDSVCGLLLHLRLGPFIQEEFYILQDSLIVDSLTTTANGYFAIDISFGEYQIAFKCLYPECVFCDFIVDNFYKDYFIDSVTYDEKPNIYIYPEEDITLDVTISFPHGGFVTESSPEYGDGWKNLKVEPSGLINKEYNYLFYESCNPDPGQYSRGWVVAQEDLELFFIKNMTTTGFNEQEITDFTDYWIPILKDYPYDAIYPQYNEQLDRIIQFQFSKEPDNILRLIYTLEGLQKNNLVLQVPEIPEFNREGFVVAEWGVIRKFENTICQK